MSPFPPDDPVTLPTWVMQYVVAPIGVGIFTLLWWLGGEVVSDWQSEREDLRSEVEDVKSEIREIKEQMKGDHGEVADYVQRLDDKMDQLYEEVAA